jgi:predicted GNAT family acetyltransferase
MAIAEYILTPDKIIFTHTEVPEELEGKGIGSALAKYALEAVRGKGRTVFPMCPFFKAYIERHKEYQSLL